MKKKTQFIAFLLCLLLFNFINFSVAQTEKGSLMIGGSGSLIASRDEQTSSLATNLRPQVGYFVRNNLLIGANLPIFYTSTQINVGSFSRSGNTLALGINAMGRYYFLPNNTKIFAHAEYGFSFLQNKGDALGVGIPNNSIESGSFANYRFGVGLAHFITPQVGLELMVDYRRQNFNYLFHNRQSLNIELGLFAYLSKKKQEGNTDFGSPTTTGTWLVGGNTGISFLTNIDNQKTSQLNLMPKVGFFVKDNFAIGLSFPLSFSRTTVASSGITAGGFNSGLTTQLNLIGANVFFRHYFLPKRTKLFAIGELGYQEYSFNADNFSSIGNNKLSNGGLAFAVGVGVAHFLSSHIAVEASIDYRNQRQILTNESRVVFLQIGMFTYF